MDISKRLAAAIFCVSVLCLGGFAQTVSNQMAVAKTDGNTDGTTPKGVVISDIQDPLVKLLIAKGLLNPAEASTIGQGRTSAEQRDRLATLLLGKGLITAAELDAIRVVQPVAAADTAAVSSLKPAESVVKTAAVSSTATAQTAPAVIPAVAPIRVLQTESTKRDGLIPDIKLGSGAKVKLYGFFKMNAIYDTSNPPGNDFPLPGFLGDSGPEGSPQFHMKVRGFRVGGNFEWLDPSPKTTITGKLELDFEGDFPRTTNRNIGTIRSNQPSLRLAWMRIDRSVSEKTSAFVLFGQDWTPFASSTMPNSIETTGFHLAYGNIYERLPQIRTGFNYNFGGKRSLKFQPEFAIALPASGNTPSDAGNQLGFGERQGPDSRMPELQGRFLTQFQLDKASGVAPAQLIASWMYGKRRVVLSRANVPTAFQTAFAGGAEVESERYGFTGEFQLPTRWFTLLGKFYQGADLRFYFGGQLFSTFNDAAGLTGTATATSIDGSSSVVFGFNGTTPVVAAQKPVRARGGFIEMGIPLSRLFGADPKGRMAGWTATLHYGKDAAYARDVRRIGAGRGNSDAAFYNVLYKYNSFITFAWEQTYFRTNASNQAGALPLYRGVGSRTTHNLRSEFATIFTF